MRKFVFISLLIPVLFTAYFYDNIRGYYRFKELCEQEKSLVVTAKLERNVGWEIDPEERTNRSVAFEIANLPYIKFVRFIDHKDGITYDTNYLNGDKKKDSSYETLPANFENKVVYQREFFIDYLPNELRMSRSGYRVVDMRTKQVVVTLSELGYSTFDRSHTLLDAPSGNRCRVAPSFLSQEVQTRIFGQ